MPVLIEGSHAVRPLTSAAFSAYVDFYANEIVPAMERHGFELLGAWQSSGGPLGRDVVLTRFPSIAEYERASASLAADPGIGKALGKLLEQVQLDEVTRLGRPLSYATEQRLERAMAVRPERPRQYGQAILEVTLAGQGSAIELLSQLVDHAESAGMMELVTAYGTTIGPRSEISDIWLLPRGVPSLDFRRESPLDRFVEPLREHAPEERYHWLNPLPYSPLQ